MIGNLLMRVKGRFEKRGLVLSYHKISEDRVDPWNIVVNPRNFERQMEYLSMSWNPVSLDNLLTGIESGSLKKKSVALCFDDGYLEHFSLVKPLLERYNIPATFFVPSLYVIEQRPYWWSELSNLVLYSRHLPAEINIKIGGGDFHFDVGRDTVLTEKIRQQYIQWKWPSVIPNKRTALFGELWNRLRTKQIPEVEEAIEGFRNLISVPPGNLERQMMNTDELKSISQSSLFTVGLHSHAHLMLGEQSREIQAGDLSKNITLLQSTVGGPITYLAYPYGSFNQDTLEIASSRGIKAAFTLREEPIANKSEHLNLGRIKARNINWQQFGQQLKSVKNMPLGTGKKN